VATTLAGRPGTLLPGWLARAGLHWRRSWPRQPGSASASSASPCSAPGWPSSPSS
jgi:hypothetical protein